MKNIGLAIAFLLLLSCGKRHQIEGNQAFALADDFSDDQCKVTPECDCCSADLILLQDNKFALIDRCLGGDTYYSGKYSNAGSKLTLNFTSKILNEISDEEYNVTGYAEREIEVGQKAFEIKLCDGKIHLMNASDSAGWQHGSRHKPQDEQELLSELPNLKAWQQLQNNPK